MGVDRDRGGRVDERRGWGIDRDGSFKFFLNDRLVMKTTTKKRKPKRSFLKTNVNEERRREETDLKGIGTYH